MTKIAEPYRCSNSSCGKAREKDANHWWLIEQRILPGERHDPVICVQPWDLEEADRDGVEHACGIDCMLQIVGRMAAAIVEGNRSEAAAPRTAVGAAIVGGVPGSLQAAAPSAGIVTRKEGENVQQT